MFDQKNTSIAVDINSRTVRSITMPTVSLPSKPGAELFYEYTPGDDEIASPVEKRASGGRFKKLLSFRRKPAEDRGGYVEDEDSQDEEEDWGRR